DRQRPEPGVFAQSQAADILHREKRLTILRYAGLVDLGNAGVMQAAEDLHLLLEAFEKRRCQQAGPDHLQGDRTLRAVLLRLLDRPHAPLAEQAQDAVTANPRR